MWVEFMKEGYNIFLVILILTVITISILSVSADDLNSSNVTTNSTNVTKNVTSKAIQPMSIWVSVNVNPSTIDFGNLAADGTTHSYTSATNVTVGAIGTTASLYVNASGDFKNGTNTIPLSNFAYGCPDSDPVITQNQFATTNTLIDSFSYFIISSKTYHMNYFLTIPVNTNSGNYSTTITYTAT